MKEKIGLLIIALVSVCAPAWTQSGATCSQAIPLGRDYEANISGAGVKWYVANTFDLPLTVRFYPKNNSDQAPDLELDFSCTSGVYEDSILCSLFCTTNPFYISLPHTATPDSKVDDQNHVYYEMAMGEFYRDLLLRTGISYNVEVYVKVTYHSAGKITLTPDAEFFECMDTDKWLLLGRTLSVAANDDETFFIAPYANWAEDSVRYIWQGSEPATVVVGTSCDFDPMDGTDDRRVDVMNMNAGGDTVNHTNEDIQYYMQYMQNPTNTAKGGIFYVKVVSTGSGTLKVERMPLPPPSGGAVLLEYNQVTPVPANDVGLFAMPIAWTQAMRFDTPTDHVFRMYVGATADFTIENAIGSYQFMRNEDGHWYGLSEAEMKALINQLPDGQKYLYVRFVCTENTTITPTIWIPSDCVDKTKIIKKDVTEKIAGKSKQIYRIYYNDWKGGDMSIAWDQSTLCKMLVSDDCAIGTNESAESIKYYEGLTNTSPAVIPASELVNWENFVDPDGFIYMRFHTTKSSGGYVALSTTAPEEQDPAPIVYPAAKIAVLCDGEPTAEGQRYIVRVKEEQDLAVYSGPIHNIASRTPITSWHQTATETHTVTLAPGTYVLQGATEQVEITVP